MWISSSAWHCPRPGVDGAPLDSVLGLPISSLHSLPLSRSVCLLLPTVWGSPTLWPPSSSSLHFQPWIPPSCPHHSSSSSPGLSPVLTSPVVPHPCDVMGPQLGTTGLPKAGLTPWQHPVSSPGRLGQSPVLSQKVQPPCDSHRAAQWSRGTACDSSLITDTQVHIGNGIPKVTYILLFHTHIHLLDDKPSLRSSLVAPCNISCPMFLSAPHTPCLRTMSWPVPCRPPLKTMSSSDLSLAELCLLLLAANTGPISGAAHVICTLEFY